MRNILLLCLLLSFSFCVTNKDMILQLQNENKELKEYVQLCDEMRDDLAQQISDQNSASTLIEEENTRLKQEMLIKDQSVADKDKEKWGVGVITFLSTLVLFRNR